jgi:hypothetical protein
MLIHYPKIPLANDIRPYFTIHDKEHAILVNKLPPKAGVLLGVTNPFFGRSCSHWPHELSLGRHSSYGKSLLRYVSANISIDGFQGKEYAFCRRWASTGMEDQNA